MAVNLPQTGFYMIRTSRGSGIVKATAGSTLNGTNSAAYFLGTTETAIRTNFNRAVGALGTLSLYEMPGGISGIAHQAATTGAAVFQPSQAGIQADWTPVYGLAAILAIGGLIAAPIIGAGATVGAEAGAAGAGAAGAGAEGAAAGGAAGTAGEAAAGGAAGGTAASGAKSLISKALSGAASKGGAAVAGASVLGLFTSGSLWKGVGLVLAGAILILLALMQFTGSSPVRVASKLT